MNEFLTKEELQIIQSLKNQKDSTQKNVEIASLQVKVAELLYNNSILKLYIKYGLSGSDGIDEQTGQIVRGEPDNDEKEMKDGQEEDAEIS